MREWKTILFPTDFSDHSRRGLQVACDLARRHRARLVLLHVVVDAPPALLPDVAGFRYDEMVEALRARAAESLPALLGEDEGRDVDLRCRTEFGIPHAEIVRVAADEGVDLIVMPTHGRTGAMHLLIGSVTEKVVRHAHCPVLVLK
ncbi:MAG: universal stress protein [Acidobacteriota bacterium]|nr:universal stress protein [Acidobacteriota bacterium]MDQ7088277.1 universal stress protein [Acidobacteriota bacterium]